MAHTAWRLLALLAVAVAVAPLATCTALRSPLDKPNIVVLFADDFGFGDLSSYGHPSQEPGELDRLAAEGLRFTQWYAGESLCTPSRAALMTGRLPIRSGMIPPQGSEARVLAPNDSGGLPSNETTIAEALKTLGYATHMSGKWHLGINNNSDTDGHHLPSHHGFDTVGTLLPFSNHWACDEHQRHLPHPNPDMCFVYHNTTLVQQPIDHSNLTANIVQGAIDFIHERRHQPFFAYVAFAHMHVSMFNADSFTNSSDNGIWGDGVREMQWGAGLVIDSIRQAGLANNTLVFFTSDHGLHIELCLEGGRTGGLKGGKAYSSWEGGLKVPALAWWPGTIQPGRVSSALATTMDIFATAVDLAGGKLPSDRVYDGKSLRHVLMDVQAPSPHQALFHYCADVLMAVRYGPYKIRYYEEQLPFDNYTSVHCTHGSPHGEFFQTWNCHGDGVTALVPPQIINIGSDPGENYPQRIPSTCTPNGTVYPAMGMPGAGYREASLGNLDQCRSLCCSDDACGSVTFTKSNNFTTANCTKGKPCCFLNPLVPSSLAPRSADQVVAFVEREPQGPYASILKQVQAIVKDHRSSIQHVQAQLDTPKAATQPCCGGGTNCTCNYPNPNPSRSP